MEIDFSKYSLRRPVFEPYEYREFPKWLFHKEHGAKIFNNPAEVEAAGDGWVDSPAKLEFQTSEPIEQKETSKKTRKKKAV